MLETLLIRSRAVPPEPPRRRGATSVGPERDRFGVLWGEGIRTVDAEEEESE